MKVFISWSGKDSISQKVAIELSKWLKMIIQNVEPWVSTEITSGEKWNETIDKNLLEAAMGIICVTKENINSPWLNFEAGAIAKGVSSNRVIPLLINLKPSDLSDSPLAHYQAKSLDKTNFLELLNDINGLCDNKIDKEILVDLFNHCWDDFNNRINGFMSTEPKKVEKIKSTKPTEEILEEVLSLTRDIKNDLSFRVGRLERVIETANRANYSLDDIRNERFYDDTRNRGSHYEKNEMEITDKGSREIITARNEMINHDIKNMLERGMDSAYIINTLSAEYKISNRTAKVMLERFFNGINNYVDSSNLNT